MNRLNRIIDNLWKRLGWESQPSPPPDLFASEQRQNERQNEEVEEEGNREEEEEQSRDNRTREERGGEMGDATNDQRDDTRGQYRVSHNIDIRRHFNQFLTAYSISPIHPHASYPIEIKGLMQKAYHYIRKQLLIEESLKVHVTTLVRFYKENADNDIQSQHFCLRSYVISFDDSISEMLSMFESKLCDLISAYETRGSGYVFERIVHLDVILIRYHPIEAGCYVPLPKHLKNKQGHSLLNIKMPPMDNRCLLFAVLACIFPRARGIKNKFDTYPHI